MGNDNLDKDVDDGLTEEERAALAEDDEEEAKTEPESKEDEGDGDDDKEGDEPADDDAGAEGRDDGKPPEGEEEEKTDEQEGGDKQVAAPTAQGPMLIAEAPADAEARLKAIDELKADLRAKYEDGDITFDEYDAKKDELTKQEREIERAVDRAQIASAMENQRLMNEWQKECDAFLGRNPEIKEKQRLYNLFNEEVKAVGTAKENEGLSMSQVLEKAKSNLIEDGLMRAPAKPATNGTKAKLPPNLAKLPAAEGEDMQGGKWAAMDRLGDTDPIAYEDALAKMSEADRNAYLAAQ